MSDIETLLLAYADGELDPEEARNVERLLERDPRAQQQLKIYRETTALLRAACAEPFYRDVPEKLIETVQRARPRTLAPRRAAYAVAASVLLASLGFAAGYGIGTRPPSEYDALMDEISEYHGVYARDSSHLVEVPASRTGEIEAWLGEHIGGHLTVPDLSAAGFDFAGGRLVVVGGRSVAQLLYTRPGTLPLGLCVTKLTDAPERPRLEHRGELNLISWRDGAYIYVLVGDLADGQMRKLATRVSAEFRGGA